MEIKPELNSISTFRLNATQLVKIYDTQITNELMLRVITICNNSSKKNDILVFMGQNTLVYDQTSAFLMSRISRIWLLKHTLKLYSGAKNKIFYFLLCFIRSQIRLCDYAFKDASQAFNSAVQNMKRHRRKFDLKYKNKKKLYRERIAIEKMFY